MPPNFACRATVKLITLRKERKGIGERGKEPQGKSFGVLQLEMHDEIFHFELFKNFMEILKYFETSSLKYFMKFLIFIVCKVT